MNPLTHSPGPWQWCLSADGSYYLGDEDRSCLLQPIMTLHERIGRPLLTVRHARGHFMPLTPDHPDAKLIEAAPALLDCLRLVAYSLGRYRTDPADFADGIETLEESVRLALSLAQTQPGTPPEGRAA